MGRWKKKFGVRWKALAAALALMLVLTACRSTADQLQEQLDLGQRYLQELNYTEAIAAFTKAIEIDPRRPDAYLGRADAYMGLYESGGEENLQLAQADYEEALRLDDQQVEVYLRLAALYIQQGETEKALALLQQGYEATGDQRLATAAEPEAEAGPVAFGQRNGYQNFESLTAEDQQAIREAAAALQAGDWETARARLQAFSLPGNLYTEMDGYRVEIYVSSMLVTFEMRPESGRGYAYEWASTEDGVYETRKAFDCVGWQCNGAWSLEMGLQAAQEDGNSYHIEAEGQAEDNLGTADKQRDLQWQGTDRDMAGEMRMENGVITYAVVHGGGVIGDMEVPDAVGSETEMMTMEWEAW